MGYTVKFEPFILIDKLKDIMKQDHVSEDYANKTFAEVLLYIMCNVEKIEQEK